MSELTALLAHGLLHLVGWDHDTPTKDRRMRAEAGRLCEVAAAPERHGRGARRMPHATKRRANRRPAPPRSGSAG